MLALMNSFKLSLLLSMIVSLYFQREMFITIILFVLISLPVSSLDSSTHTRLCIN